MIRYLGIGITVILKECKLKDRNSFWLLMFCEIFYLEFTHFDVRKVWIIWSSLKIAWLLVSKKAYHFLWEKQYVWWWNTLNIFQKTLQKGRKLFFQLLWRRRFIFLHYFLKDKYQISWTQRKPWRSFMSKTLLFLIGRSFWIWNHEILY